LIFISLLAVASSFDVRKVKRIELGRNASLIAIAFILSFNAYLLYDSIYSFKYGLKWKDAFIFSNTNPEEASFQYEKIHPILKKNRSFLLNEGSIFYNSEQYCKCIEHYEKYKYLFISSDMYLMLGYSYEKLENYPKAEENYRMASNLIPHLFVPRYKLFKLYLKQDEISGMKIKVYSEKVKDIKTEVNEYLYNSSSNSR
jgi:tetratricopeptide (TPR) repeat protein